MYIEYETTTATPNEMVDRYHTDVLLIHSEERGVYLLCLIDGFMQEADPDTIDYILDLDGFVQLAAFSPGINYDWNATARMAFLVDGERPAETDDAPKHVGGIT